MSFSAGGDDIDEWKAQIAKLDNDIREAVLKSNSNDPDERAHWRKSVTEFRSERLTLLNLILERERKETERERKETERERKETKQIDLILERERKKANKIDVLIRLGKIGDNTMLCSVSKYWG